MPDPPISEDQQYIDELNEQTVEYYYEGKYQLAQHASNIALQEAENCLGKNTARYASALYNTTIFLDMDGKNEEAIERFQTVKDIEEQLGVDADELSLTYNVIGYAYRTLGDYHNALTYLNQAIQLRTEASLTDTTLAAFMSDKALCLEYLGLLDSAKVVNKACLELIDQLEEKEHLFVQQVALYCYQNLAAIALEENMEDDSIEPFLRQAERITQQYNPSQKTYYTYELWSRLKLREADCIEAHWHANEAVFFLEEELGDLTKDVKLGQLYTLKALIYQQEGELEKSLDCHQRALDAIKVQFAATSIDEIEELELEQFINKLHAIEVLVAKARTLKLNHQLEAAYETYQLATELIPATRRSYKETGSKYQLAQSMVPVYEEAISLALELFNKTQKKSYKEAAFALSESNKAVLLLEDMQHEIAKNKTFDLPESLLQKEENIRHQINSLERQIYTLHNDTKAGNKELGDLNNQLLHYREQYNNELKKELSQYPKYWSLRYDIPNLSIEQIQKDILSDDKTALLEFFVGQKSIYLFYIDREEFTIQTISKTPEIKTAIDELKNIVSNSPNNITVPLKAQHQAFSELSYFLYQVLLEETLSFGQEDLERLIIIPDDKLYDIPMDILLTCLPSSTDTTYALAKNDYLFEDFALSYHYSCHLFGFNQEKVKKKGKFVGLAPSFSPAQKLLPLKYAKQEVQEIATLLKGTAIFGENVTIQCLKNNADSAHILHLATHAEQDQAHGKLNKIFLYDTVLTNYDLEDIQFNTALVVLSACNTGSGKILNSEGAMTLARSIIRSGSPSVLATSWQIEDKTSKEIMLNFYKNIKNGMTIDKALQAAKKQYLSNFHDKQHPFYWASFQQYGRSDAIY